MIDGEGRAHNTNSKRRKEHPVKEERPPAIGDEKKLSSEFALRGQGASVRVFRETG